MTFPHTLRRLREFSASARNQEVVPEMVYVNLDALDDLLRAGELLERVEPIIPILRQAGAHKLCDEIRALMQGDGEGK